MTDTDRATTNLGKIILGLANHCTYVRFHSVDSIMSRGMYVIRAYTVRNGVTSTHEELITELAMSEISDPSVIVDAFLAKMKSAQPQKPMKK